MEPTKKDLYRIIRNKDRQLDQYKKGNGARNSYAWALLEALGREHVLCSCGGETKPRKNSNTGFLFMACKICGKSIQVTSKKKKTHTAYDDVTIKLRKKVDNAYE